MRLLQFKSRSGRALPIILLACTIVALGAGVGVGVFVGTKAMAKGAAKEKAKPEKVEPKTVYSLGEMVVNLSDKGTLRYAKITVAVGFKEKIEEEKLKEVAPLLRDSVINVVTDKSFADLHSGNGVRKLKAEIKKAIAERMEGKEVVDIYLDGFAMQ